MAEHRIIGTRKETFDTPKPHAHVVIVATAKVDGFSKLWTITQVNRWCEKQGQDFKLVPGSEPVRNIFEVTGLSDVLPFDGENPSERRPPV